MILLFLSYTAISSGTEIENINTLIQAKGAKWVAGETAVSRLSLSERKRMCGFVKPSFTGSEKVLSVSRSMLNTLPMLFDWRDNNGNFVTPVRDQGTCNSCWAFAVTAGLESYTLIKNNSPDASLDLSEQVLISCSKTGNCEDGGLLDVPSDFLRDTGLPLESCYPYTARNGDCGNACKNWPSSAHRIGSWRWIATDLVSISTLKAALYHYGPLPAALVVYSDFVHYKQGIYSRVSDSKVGEHAVLIVGYNDNDGCFIAKNSWGTDWGEAGFFRIAYTEVEGNIKFGMSSIAYESTFFTISPSSASYGIEGGSGEVQITTQGDYAWNAMSLAPWITIQSGGSGMGSGTMTYSVAPHTGTSRTGAISIAGRQLTVSQEGISVSLGEAVDNTALSWTTSGNVNWYGQTSEYYTAGSSARSGRIKDDETTRLETTVIGPAQVSFYWKASSELDNDRLIFSIDYTDLDWISGEVDWQSRVFSIPAGQSSLRWTYRKDSSVSDGSDCAWIDQVEVLGGPACQYSLSPIGITATAEETTGEVNVLAGSNCRWAAICSEPWISVLSGARGMGDGTVTYKIAENLGPQRVATLTIGSQTLSVTQSAGRIPRALDNEDLNWATGGDADWFATTTCYYAGGSAAKSGSSFRNRQVSWLETNISGPAQLSFYWKVISEVNYDFLTFYLDGTPIYAISGDVDWQQRAVFIPPGKHNLRWDYKKDNYVSYGEDSGWLDKVELFTIPEESFSIAPQNTVVAINGGSGTVNVTAPGGGCWVAASNVPWITVTSGTRGVGSDIVSYTVSANTGAERTGTIVIGSQTFTVFQGSAIAVSLDDASRTWRTGGDAGWIGDATTFYSGGSSARSGPVGRGKTSFIETTVSGPALISFYWKLNSYNPLTFYIDNASIYSIENRLIGVVDWEQRTYFLPTGSHVLKWEHKNDTSDGAGSQYGWLDKFEVFGGSRCSYSLSPVSADASAGGGEYTVKLETGDECGWLAVSSDPWIIIKSSAVGKGNAAITYSVEANEKSSPRSGAVIIGTQRLQIIQSQQSIPLAEVLDNPHLTWTTGGSASWFGQSSDFKYGGSSARSGTVRDNENSWMETRVTGPAVVSFYWKASSEGASDLVRLYIDGSTVHTISGYIDWQKESVDIGAGDHLLRWEYSKDTDGIVGSDCGWLDRVEVFGGPTCSYSLSPAPAPADKNGEIGTLNVATSNNCSWMAISNDYWISIVSADNGGGNGTVTYKVAANYDYPRTGTLTVGGQTFTVSQDGISCPLGEAVDNKALIWTTGGDLPWIGKLGDAYYGTGSARSGTLGLGQASWLETTITGPGQIVFHWTVSSNTMGFYLDGTLIDSINGYQSWREKSYSIPAGVHTLRWVYVRKEKGGYGDDHGGIDKVEFFGGPACSYTLDRASATAKPESGETGSIIMHTDQACQWRAVSSVSWLRIYQDNPASGTGTVNYWVDSNMTDSQRTGAVSIGTETFSVIQAPLTLGIALDNESLKWTTGGDNKWFIYEEFNWNENKYYYNSRSGYLLNNNTSWIETNVAGPVLISFYWQASSSGYGRSLRFYVDDSLIYSLSHNDESSTWLQKLYRLPPGNHTLRWAYVNDDEGDDQLTQYGYGSLDKVSVFGGPDCTFSLPVISADFAVGGGTGSVPVNVNCNNSWLAVADVPWITVLSSNGTGENGLVEYAVAANPGAARVGTITIDTQKFTVQQEGSADPFGDAIEASGSYWATGGDNIWYIDRSGVYYSGFTSLRSGCLGDNGASSWIETAVKGPAKISFYWKITSYDELILYIDGVRTDSITGKMNWQQQSYILPTGNHTIRWLFKKKGTGGYCSDGAWLDQFDVTTTCSSSFNPIQATIPSQGGTYNVNVEAGDGCDWQVKSNVLWITALSGGSGKGNGTVEYAAKVNPASERSGTLTIGTQTFTVNQQAGGIPEAVDSPSLLWTTGGDADWSVSTDVKLTGGGAAQNGVTDTDKDSWLETVVTGPAQISFHWKKSLSLGRSSLGFSIDSHLIDSVADAFDWQRRTYILQSGSHRLRWNYHTDYHSFADDRVWLDKLEVLGGPQCTYSLSASEKAATAPGGVFHVTVNTSSGCRWAAMSDMPWLTVLSDVDCEGTGNVTYRIDANSKLSSRTGTLTIGTQTYTVTQAGADPVSLGQALDNTLLTWTSGGVASWFGQNTVDLYGGSSVRSGVVPDYDIYYDAYPWLETIINGPAQVSFYWRSSTATDNPLSFSVDGKALNYIRGDSDWQRVIHSLSMGLHVLRWHYSRMSSTNYGENCGWLDKVEVFDTPVDSLSPAGGRAGPDGGVFTVSVSVCDDCGWLATSETSWITLTQGESGKGSGTVRYSVAANPSGAPRTGSLIIGNRQFTIDQDALIIPIGAAVEKASLPWATGGDANWSIDGTVYLTSGKSARSGAIGYEKTSWVETTVTGPAYVSFYWKIHPGHENDLNNVFNFKGYLKFYFDQNLLFSISGNVDWQRQSYFVPEGNHVLRWKYETNSSTGNALSGAWLDRVEVLYAGDILMDIIAALKLMAGMMTEISVEGGININTDGRIGIAEVIYLLQTAAGLR